MLQELKSYFQKSMEDLKLTSSERKALDALLQEANLKPNQLGDLRSSIFKLAKSELTHLKPIQILEWLENANKLINKQLSGPASASIEVYFSPGEDCRNAIATTIKEAKRTLDICVFTISDDMLASEIRKAQQRGVKVRLITDNDKTYDKGSDIYKLKQQGLSIRTDDTPNHMHHKFAIVDGEKLINGSYNWTRSAFAYNNENITISESSQAIRKFQQEFDRLWGVFWDY